MRDRFINVLIVIVIAGLALIAILDINRRIKQECKRACVEKRDADDGRKYQRH